MNEIFYIAQDARRWVERKAGKPAPRFKNAGLSGWCAIASGHLYRQLANAGIKSEIHLHENNKFSHAYVVVDDHVVDVTATQFYEFKRTPVVILHQKEAEQYEFYNSTQVFNFPAELRDYQFKLGWPKDQIVLTR